MTFLERNRVLIGLVAAATIALGTFAAFAVQGGMFRSGYEIEAAFADASGLDTGDAVLVAGVRSGEVRKLEIEGDRVVATLFIEGAELTHDTRARIIVRTIVGKRALALETSDDWSATLAQGDRIPLERTDVPTDVPELGDVAEELLSETDAELLDAFLSAVTDTVRGQRAQVAALVDGGTRLTGVVNEQEAEVRELLRRLRDVAEAFASRDEELVRIIDDFGTVVATLAERREDVRLLLRETNRTSAVAAALVEDQHTELDAILSELHEVTDLVAENQLALAEGLAHSGDSIKGFASIFEGAGGAELTWGDVFVTSLGPAGVDVVAGCGGLLDQALDDVFGPDPRTCEEQEGRSLPEDAAGDDEEQGPELPELMPGGSASEGLDALARRALVGGAGGERR